MNEHTTESGGYTLALRRFPSATRAVAPGSRPVLLVPGYGMNSFIFSYHPGGLSLVHSLADAGLDVWTVDLRGQGESKRAGDPTHAYGLADLAFEDVPRAAAKVREITGSPRIDLVGCSLGAALTFAHLARDPAAAAREIGSVVALAGLVTWRDIHPLVRVAFASPRLAGAVRLTGTRELSRRALPVLARFARPLLSAYINPQTTDIREAEIMVRTVEDPSPRLNREIAEWVNRRELVVGGVNVSAYLRDFRAPFQCVVPLQDRIVPAATARLLYEQVGSTDRELVEVGSAKAPVAHADLFLGRDMQTLVFQRVAAFLLSRAVSSS